MRKITTFFEKREASKSSKLSLGAKKIYEHTAKLNFKGGSNYGNKNETGLEQLGSHSTNNYHTVGRIVQTDTPASTGDYRRGPDIQTEKERTSTNLQSGEGPN